MRIAHSILSSLVAAVAPAQSVTVPADALVGPPHDWGWYSSTFFFAHPQYTPDSREQAIFATADIPLSAATWNAVSVRRPGQSNRGRYYGNNLPAMTTNAVITMSTSPRPWTDTNTHFASNHGANVVTVFRGQLSLPAAPAQRIWPCPWQAPFPFTAPFPYVAAGGNTLVFDIVQTGNTADQSWLVEAYWRDLGNIGDNGGNTCRFSNGGWIGLRFFQQPFLGYIWTTMYGGNLPANLPAVGVIGSQGVGGTWGSTRLPLDLTPFGAPGCSWNIDAVATMPLQVTGAGNSYRWPDVPVPDNPHLVGTVFYEQALFLDPPANALGLVSGISAKWIIGSGAGPRARRVAETHTNTMNPNGQNTASFGTSLRFD